MLGSKLFDGLKRISTPFRTRAPHRDGARRRPGFRRPGLECLERRELLSLAGWSFAVGGPDYERGRDTAVDTAGNVYVTGKFSDTVDFDPGPGVEELTSEAGLETFVAKYDPNGGLLWARSDDVGYPSRPETAIAVDASGNATVAIHDGRFWHLEANGNTLWSQAIVSTRYARASDVAVDADGDIYIAGGFSETADFGTTASGEIVSLTSTGSSDIFVAKYAPTGEVIWAQRAGSTNSDFGEGAYGIAVDGQDPDNVYVYLTGRAVNGAEFGGETVILDQAKKGRPKPTGAGNIFVAKLDAVDGTFQWTSMAGGRSLDAGEKVTVDGNGDVYITGTFRSESASFGSHTINNIGYYDAFATKLDPAGNFLWARGMGGSEYDWGYSVSADDVGNVYVGGFSEIGGDFGPFELTNITPYPPGVGFLAKLDAVGGNVLSAQGIGWGIYSVSIGSDRAIHLTGGFATEASGEQFPTGETLISTPQANGSPSDDIFVSKMEPGAPGIRSLAVIPEPVVQGEMLTLSAHGVLDVGGRVDSVAFYRDANGDGLFDPDDDLPGLLGTDTDVSNAWGVTVSTGTFPLGPQTYFAVATDDNGDTSDAASATGEVVDQPPAGANDIYVWDIQFDSRLRGKGGSKHDERIMVEVRRDSDADGVAEATDEAVAGASLTVEVRNSGGGLVGTLSGTTDTAGVFVSVWLSDLPDDTYTAEVVGLTHATFAWNQSLDPTANDSDVDGDNLPDQQHTIPHGSGASAAASVDALDQLMAGLGGTTRSGGGDDDSDPVFGSLQDDVLIDLLFG